MRNHKQIIKKYLILKIGLNDYRAEQEYLGLHRYEDIEQEFLNYILNKQERKKSIEVEGYTAEMLHKQYPLSILGAYNYLIYLRENPKEAIMNLEKGLPRW